MLETHISVGNCMGRPSMYSSVTGKFYYRTNRGNGLGSGSLYIRKSNLLNALIGLDASVKCFRMLAIDAKVREYALEDLPIEHAGTVPRYELRDFTPLVPSLPNGVDVEVRHDDPNNLVELESLINTGEIEGLDREEGEI